MELWKDIEGYGGLYQVSDCGRVKNSSGHIMCPADNGKGYMRFSLSSGSRNYKTHYLHRLMAEAFIPNPKNHPEVNHKDERKNNNSLDNLEWCTVEYNRLYGTRVERSSKARRVKVVGTNLRDGSTITLNGLVDAEMYGLNRSAVSNCVQGLTKSSGGYSWTYAS